VLTLAASRGWPVHQLDVNNAFLHGVLDETIYARQPAGFVDKSCSNKVCKLNKSLYKLKQAPRAWYTRFAGFLGELGFRPTRSDSSLFVLRRGDECAYILLYVDDIVLTASSSTLLQRVINNINAEFKLKDMGSLHYFLGIQVQRSPSGFFLHQHHPRHPGPALAIWFLSSSTPVRDRPPGMVWDARLPTVRHSNRHRRQALSYLRRRALA